jgi:hypothetical protein
LFNRPYPHHAQLSSHQGLPGLLWTSSGVENAAREQWTRVRDGKPRLADLAELVGRMTAASVAPATPTLDPCALNPPVARWLELPAPRDFVYLGGWATVVYQPFRRAVSCLSCVPGGACILRYLLFSLGGLSSQTINQSIKHLIKLNQAHHFS